MVLAEAVHVQAFRRYSHDFFLAQLGDWAPSREDKPPTRPQTEQATGRLISAIT
jgi:hypothetical protein